MTDLVKHRRLIIRNSLAELEATVFHFLEDDWQFDEVESESIIDAMKAIYYERKSIAIPVFKMGKPGEVPAAPFTN